MSEEKTIVAYAQFVIKYTGDPERSIEEAIENIKFEGEDPELYKYKVVDSVVVDIHPIRVDF